jgi:hypothetical protein
MPTVFIIYGHDIEARDELEKFVISLGFEVLPFHRAADKDEKIETILGNVLSGIEQADLVIVLDSSEEFMGKFRLGELGK